jgi:predicted dehydrogenase
MKYKTLLIGCGNIGAMYDWDTSDFTSYAKALHHDGSFDLDVYDTDETLAQKVAERYKANIITHINEFLLEKYSLVIIASPTSTHYSYLKQLLRIKTPLIICEKPVTDKLEQLDELKLIYNNNAAQSRVIVNYYRRFQPALINIKKTIEHTYAKNSCTSINVTYQRGLHNNGSHALDLIQFLFSEKIEMNNVYISSACYDEFKTDATRSLHLNWGDTNVNFIGLANVSFSFFEIHMYFKNSLIRMFDGGNKIEILEAPAKKTEQTFYPKPRLLHSFENCLKDYMLPLIGHAKQLLENKHLNDNFLDAVDVSRTLLNIQEHSISKHLTS